MTSERRGQCDQMLANKILRTTELPKDTQTAPDEGLM